MSVRALKVFFATIFGLILSYYVAVLLHEYSHATTAWILGYKKSPFDIYIGSWLLMPVSESVNYAKILASGHGVHEALIGISGITTTFILFLISLFFMNISYIKESKILLSFFFWLMNINLMEMFSYINRTFIMGDLWEFIQGMNISPLWIFIPGVIIVGLGLYRFYRVEIIKMYKYLPIKSQLMQRIFLWLTLWSLSLAAIYWEKPLGWESLSYITNFISVLIIISILIICDSSRNWIKKRIMSS